MCRSISHFEVIVKKWWLRFRVCPYATPQLAYIIITVQFKTVVLRVDISSIARRSWQLRYLCTLCSFIYHSGARRTNCNHVNQSPTFHMSSCEHKNYDDNNDCCCCCPQSFTIATLFDKRQKSGFFFVYWFWLLISQTLFVQQKQSHLLEKVGTAWTLYF